LSGKTELLSYAQTDFNCYFASNAGLCKTKLKYSISSYYLAIYIFHQESFFMLGLLPAEYWNYKISDISRGLTATLLKRKPNGMLKIEGIGNCIPVRSARAAIIMAIKALGLPPGACVGTSLYCCPVVFKAIKAAGCTVRFIDIDPDTYCISADDLLAKISRLDAVIAVHMFGHLCDMPRILEAAQGKPIIEDCAQSLGSTLHGQMAGTFGDIAVFSFRSGKYLSAGEGGALYSNNDKLFSELTRLVSVLPVPSRMEDCVHVIKTYLRSILRSKPLWGLIGNRLWSMYNKSTDFSEKTPLVTSQMFESDIAITTNRLAKINYLIAKQRANADYYTESLTLFSSAISRENPDVFYNRYLYPLLLPSQKDRDTLAAYLLEMRIGTIQPYKDIPKIASTYYGYNNDCPMAEQVAKRVLILPCYSTLKQSELRSISYCTNKALQILSSTDEICKNTIPNERF
jgi:dTDP-4-amino-4,6-dideoxygalactose transaminase